MKTINIPYIESGEFRDTNLLMAKMEILNQEPISCEPWPAFSTDTKVEFSIAHNGNAILLKYKIQERYLAARETNNGNIHNDSCVEFFVAFHDDECYYNLEFNCLGFTKIGYGSRRENRHLISLDMISKIGFSSRINSKLPIEQEGYHWEILLVIPKETFVYHQINSFGRLQARGNFYKCGDGLPQPHFLSWNRIDTAEPDFHRMESFGRLEFLAGEEA